MFYKSIDYHGKLDRGRLIKKGKQVVLYRIYDGFGLPLDVLERIREVEIHYRKVVYRVDAEQFYIHGIKHQFGDEEQLILPRKYWRILDQGVLL